VQVFKARVDFCVCVCVCMCVSVTERVLPERRYVRKGRLKIMRIYMNAGRDICHLHTPSFKRSYAGNVPGSVGTKTKSTRIQRWPWLWARRL
jgi:hypothetical protein